MNRIKLLSWLSELIRNSTEDPNQSTLTEEERKEMYEWLRQDREDKDASTDNTRT